MALEITRVINNNVLNVRDEKGRELMVTGKGIGFGRKPGTLLPAAAVQTSYRMESSTVQRRLADLAEQIPYEDLALTDELVQHIRQSLPYPLNESLLISLADHISFAVERAKKGMNFTNPLLESIKTFYPEEYALGCWCLEKIRTRRKAALVEDEAGSIALHIVNAELNTSMGTLNDITKFVQGCLQVTEEFYGSAGDAAELDYSRFVLHLRFFAQRVLQGEQPPEETDDWALLLGQVEGKSGRHYACARKIAEYVQQAWGRRLTGEDLVLLTIHLKRIHTGKLQTGK